MASNPRFTENHQIAGAMKGVDFPADRDQIVEQAKSNGAPDQVVEEIGKLPDGDFQNVAEVMSAIGR